ncbi:MAG TPA: ABC transporter permease [Candidatus Avacidaminococcus intestinavium]|uniref:Putative hemin transport system permease protein HrtB n=1 Tax=Candidatus Avacidaminococcus intestinavium TaxID=2840684 RepID=A0A9D1SL81_9FIRM|nr:ABC transporter permease [Candidatus Avacidaminococcus intestinavium]
MNYFLLIWRNLWKNALQTIITSTIIGSSIGLLLLVILISNGVQKGLVRAVEPFDLIVGAKGSSFQVTLNTVFLQDKPVGNIDYDLLEKLKTNSNVQSAIPIGFGDNYRGYRIVGTEKSIFQHTVQQKGEPWLQFAEGRVFNEENFEAVLGSKVAKETGLKVGNEFASSHGVVEALEEGSSEHKENKFKVVGVLQSVGGPYDDAVIVPLSSIWRLHEHAHSTLVKEGAPPSAEHEHKETTVILVKPTGYAEAMSLYKEFQKNNEAQLIFPSQNVIQLLQILGEGEKILKVISYAVLIIVFAIIALSIYWSNLSKVRDRFILRALGAGRQALSLVAFGEGFLQIIFGIICGFILGHGIYYFLINFLEQKTAIAFPHEISSMEVIALLGILTIGSLISLVCSRLLYSKNIAEEI